MEAASPIAPAGYADASLSVAPNDGNVVYACSIAQDTPNARPLIWRSGDRAQTWMRVADVPLTHSDIKRCDMTIDQVDTAIAVTTIAWGAIDTATHRVAHTATFVTFDAGASWQETAVGPEQSWLTLATFGNQTLFLVHDPAPDSLGFILMVSDDQLKTARRAETPLMASGDYIRNIWMDPTHGQLVLEMRSQSDISDGTLWMSADRGQSWRATPMYTPLLGQITVDAPRAGGAWSVCGVLSNGDRAAAARAVGGLGIVCSFNGGASWRQIRGVANEASGNSRISGIAHDGSVFGFIQDTRNKSTTFYWLPPGAMEWQVRESQQRLGVDDHVVPAGAHDVF